MVIPFRKFRLGFVGGLVTPKVGTGGIVVKVAKVVTFNVVVGVVLGGIVVVVVILVIAADKAWDHELNIPPLVKIGTKVQSEQMLLVPVGKIECGACD